ncbi:hypothetical protein SAMN04488688_105144 [Paenibacillus sp. cl141a]|uniref:hypothetical protein n=1 Tax=Paenibacillus sp. cl141a TaxID=1761877 RepID=UPI0008D4AF01|nr:hypothetical protein [Paenibacillus sp. cl141a]SEL68356.1 hypothetical protein SAMN04488688_105144 [Paenibacillus sp. cl141a]
MDMGTVLGIRVDLDMAPVDLAVLDMGRGVRECSATSVKHNCKQAHVKPIVAANKPPGRIRAVCSSFIMHMRIIFIVSSWFLHDPG